MTNWTIHEGDCLEVMRGMPDASVDAVVTDPPYFRVKSEAWDRQWKDARLFLAWLGEVADEWRRVLKPNGSLYCFASPKMAARVEVMLGERFNVLNSARWYKEAGWHNKAEAGALRSFLTPWEAVVFAEPRGSDCCSPIGNRLKEARGASGRSRRQLEVAIGRVRRADPERGTELWRRWEEGSSLPTVADYAAALGACGDAREYEDLRREYEDLRRPFAVSREVPFTDLWTFPTVQAYPGKHPCEKPAALLEHIIAASTRPGALVLDSFAGSGSTGEAALRLGRKFIGIDKDAQQARARLAAAEAQPDLFTKEHLT
jgi:site-specific DNA-methyltransferase (adenine-specific)